MLEDNLPSVPFSLLVLNLKKRKIDDIYPSPNPLPPPIPFTLSLYIIYIVGVSFTVSYLAVNLVATMVCCFVFGFAASYYAYPTNMAAVCITTILTIQYGGGV